MITSPHDPRVAGHDDPRHDRPSDDRESDASFSEKLHDARRIAGDAAWAWSDQLHARTDLAKLAIRDRVRQGFLLAAAAVATLTALATAIVLAAIGLARWAESASAWPAGAGTALVGLGILAIAGLSVWIAFGIADRRSFAKTRAEYAKRDLERASESESDETTHSTESSS